MAIKAEVNTQLLKNQQAALRSCMTVDSEMGKRLRNLIYQELNAARKSIANSIRFDNGDPRHTRESIKRYVASKYLGGVVSILDGRKVGASNSYEAPRRLRIGQRGGNRMLRSQRTHDILHYGPQDRGFILRFVNSGTIPRYANGRNVTGNNRNLRRFFKLQEEGDNYRGSIKSRNFLSQLGDPAMRKAVANIGRMVDDEFEKLLKG